MGKQRTSPRHVLHLASRNFGPSWSGSKHAAAFSDGALEQAFRKGRGHEDADRYGTRGLTGDGYAFRAAACRHLGVPMTVLACSTANPLLSLAAECTAQPVHA